MSKLLEIGLTNALLATLLAIGVTLITWTWRRPALAHTLWVLVLLKLITPPLVSLPWQLPEVWEASLSSIHARSESARSTISGTSEQTTALTDAEENFPLDDDILACLVDEASLAEPQPAATNEIAAPQTPSSPFLQEYVELAIGCLGPVWFGVSAWIMGLSFVRMIAFSRLLRYGRPASAALQELSDDLARRMGLGRCPSLWLIPGRVSPLVWCLGGRARLVLPISLLRQLDPAQQSTLLAHELAHARRRDHWVRWLELLATSIYWWHPVAWWARRKIQQAEEECCDAWVVWMLPKAAKAYARALVQTVDFLDARAALPPMASGIGHVHFLKRRLAMIVHRPLRPHLSRPLCYGALLLALLVLPLAPQRLPTVTANQAEAALVMDDETQSSRPSGDRDTRDLDRRLQALERRLERALQSLERGAQQRDRPRQDSDEDKEKSAKEKAKDQEKRMKEVREALEKRAKEMAERQKVRAKEMAERQAKLAKEMAERREKQAKDEKGEQSPRRSSELRDGNRVFRFNMDFDGKFDPEQMKRLQKQIEEAVQQAVNPERMKALERQIERTVEKSINPERMKQLDKQIEELVNRNFNPERMQALARQIESAVNRSLDAEKRDQARQTERARSSEKSAKAAAKETKKEGSGDRKDLERRLDELERKLERLTQAVERLRR